MKRTTLASEAPINRSTTLPLPTDPLVVCRDVGCSHFDARRPSLSLYLSPAPPPCATTLLVRRLAGSSIEESAMATPSPASDCNSGCHAYKCHESLIAHHSSPPRDPALTINRSWGRTRHLFRSSFEQCDEEMRREEPEKDDLTDSPLLRDIRGIHHSLPESQTDRWCLIVTLLKLLSR